MCLIIKKNQKLKTAKEDMIVFKKFYFRDGELISSIMGTRYELGKLYTAEIKLSPDQIAFDTREITAAQIKYKNYRDECDFVGAGFHSATTKERYTEAIGDTIAECIIPKGSLYYKGLTDLLVSNQIIIKKIIWNKA